MWGRKRAEVVANRLCRVERDVQVQAQRLKVLECSHEKVAFDAPVSDPLVVHEAYTPYPFVYQKRCELCGKILETYQNCEEILTAKLSYMRTHCSEEVAQVERELKKEVESRKRRCAPITTKNDG